MVPVVVNGKIQATMVLLVFNSSRTARILVIGVVIVLVVVVIYSK